MKTKYLLTILLTGMTLFLANCSKSNSNGASTTTSTGTYNSCSAGYVWVTQTNSCLPTAVCTQHGLSADYGYNQATNQCIQGTYSNGTTTTSGSPVCNGMSGYVSVNGTCLPEQGCTQYRGQNGVAYYGYRSNGSQWACYPQGYQGQWYN